MLYVPDYFVTQQLLRQFDGDDDNFFRWHGFRWYKGYKKRKAQKASIKEELMPIAWHPSRWWDWCVPEDEKRDTEALWA